MKLTSKWMELENVILSEVTQSQKKNKTKKNNNKKPTWYILTDKWILGKKIGIPMIQLTDYTKFKK